MGCRISQRDAFVQPFGRMLREPYLPTFVWQDDNSDGSNGGMRGRVEFKPKKVNDQSFES